MSGEGEQQKSPGCWTGLVWKTSLCAGLTEALKENDLGLATCSLERCRIFIGHQACGEMYQNKIGAQVHVHKVDSCLFRLAECVSVERLTLDTPASGSSTEPLSLRPARFYQHNDITLEGWGWWCHWVWQTGSNDTSCTCWSILYRSWK